MKRSVFFLLVMALIANIATAQNSATPQKTKTVEKDSVVFPRNLVGIRGGLNLATMAYSYDLINKYYDRYLQPQGMIGLSVTSNHGTPMT